MIFDPYADPTPLGGISASLQHKMKYIDEFFNDKLCQELVQKIIETSDGRTMTFMEVCGTHTMAIFRYGIKSLLPPNIKLLSGPGCPVCVTPNSDIDKMIAYACQDNVIIATFGDMMRVPGSTSSLSQEKALGRDIKIVYSVNDALKIAETNLDKSVIFIGVGFETTAPSVAVSIRDAKIKGLSNYFVFCAHKIIPPAMKVILDSGELKLDGFILPGHVSTIIGTMAYEFISQDYHIPCVVAGFEATDILQAILMLTNQVVRGGISCIENQYKRSVKAEGNPKALAILNEVFEPIDSEWRGIGIIPNSGLKIRQEYKEFDAEQVIPVGITLNSQLLTLNSQCICGDILRGIKIPTDCKLFGNACIPETPVGPCMVSSEGTCSAYYKYQDL